MKYLPFLLFTILISCKHKCDALSVQQVVEKNSIFKSFGDSASPKDYIIILNDFRLPCNNKLDLVLLEAKFVDSITTNASLNSLTFITKANYELAKGNLDSLSISKYGLLTFYFKEDTTGRKKLVFRNLIGWDREAMK